MGLRMRGDWCITWERAAHVVKLDKGWYRIVLYEIEILGAWKVPKYRHVKAIYATNRRDANHKCKLLVSGEYDNALSQPRLF